MTTVASSTPLEEKQEQADEIRTSPTEVITDDGPAPAAEPVSKPEAAAEDNGETARPEDPPLDPRRAVAPYPILGTLCEP